MSHAHHAHTASTHGRTLGLSILLTIAFVVGEALTGYFAHSLALLSDAGHNLSDALALIFSWFAIRIAQRPSDSRRTYGYHRVGILVALVNAVSLVVLALWIFWEAFQRLQEPGPVQSVPMIVVALIAVVLNGLISVWLHSGAKHDLNVRSAYLHMIGDALSALGVVVAGIVVATTGATVADPIVSLLIGALILWSSWGILTEAVDVLLEAAPKGINMASLERAIKGVPDVVDAHDLHVWTVASGIIACSCHIVVEEQSASGGQQIHRAVAAMLRHEFGVSHTTIQVEVDGCASDDLYCTMHPLRNPHAGHNH